MALNERVINTKLLPQTRKSGALFINADDWGRDRRVMDCILDCYSVGAISSVSAMVFMEDSDRAAKISLERGIDSGLHLNLTAPLSAPGLSSQLLEHHSRIAKYLLEHRLSQVVFHPGLMNSFNYVVKSQIEEYSRLYKGKLGRMDGHHHMHLSANVLLGGLLPHDIIVRRNFHFEAGEKSLANRLYRSAIDRILARHHIIVDYFFAMGAIKHPSRFERIISLARRNTLELSVHPAVHQEYQLLIEGSLLPRNGTAPFAGRFAISGLARNTLQTVCFALSLFGYWQEFISSLSVTLTAIY
jgi:chitin disaccharide deacetylase